MILLDRDSMAALADTAPPATPGPPVEARRDPVFRRPMVAEFRPDSIGLLLRRSLDQPPRPDAVDEYLLYLPPGLEAGGRSWPLVLYLHGRSLSGDDLDRVDDYGLPRYLGEGWELPAVVVAPQAPEGQRWTDTARLAELVRRVAAAYPVDLHRIYLTGYSMGAGGAWRMVRDYPRLFAAAAILGAWTPEPGSLDPAELRGLPLRVIHGTNDPVAPYDRVVAMVEALAGAGVPVELVTHAGVGHGLTQVYRDPRLYDWLLGHRRSEPGAWR